MYMGLDIFSVGLGMAIGAGGLWAYENGYITLPNIQLPCPSGQYLNTDTNTCVGEPACGTGEHIDSSTMPHTCVPDTTGYARAFIARRGGSRSYLARPRRRYYR